jgi:hypothetical protein
MNKRNSILEGLNSNRLNIKEGSRDEYWDSVFSKATKLLPEDEIKKYISDYLKRSAKAKNIKVTAKSKPYYRHKDFIETRFEVIGIISELSHRPKDPSKRVTDGLQKKFDLFKESLGCISVSVGRINYYDDIIVDDDYLKLSDNTYKYGIEVVIVHPKLKDLQKLRIKKALSTMKY